MSDDVWMERSRAELAAIGELTPVWRMIDGKDDWQIQPKSMVGGVQT